jgi:hypothetical protein
MRPVQGSSVSLFSEHGYRALEVLAQTSTPIRRLTIPIVDASAQCQRHARPKRALPSARRAPTTPPEALDIVAPIQ